MSISLTSTLSLHDALPIYHVRGPHPGVDDDDRPRRQRHRAQHFERRRRDAGEERDDVVEQADLRLVQELPEIADQDRKSTRLNSSHLGISYAVFCLKKKRV